MIMVHAISNQNYRQKDRSSGARTVFRVAIGAGGSGLILGLVIGSFSAAGIVDMTGATLHH